MSLKERGQATMETLIGIPITVIGLLVVFILLDPIGLALFNVLNAANSEVISNVATIKLLIGLIGLIVAIMAIVGIVNSFRQQSQVRYQ